MARRGTISAALVALAAALVAGPAPASAAVRTDPAHVLVHLRAGASIAGLDGAQLGDAPRDALEALGRTYAIRLPAGDTVAAAVTRLEAQPGVAWAEPVASGPVLASTTPNDAMFGDQWNLTAIDAPAAWDIVTDASKVLVGVVDTGIAVDRPNGDPNLDLDANLWHNPGEVANHADDDGNGFVDDVLGWNFADNDGDIQDLDGHGTHVAGIIGAVGNDGSGTTGVAWRAALMGVRVINADGGSTTAEIAQGLAYAGREGARVVNGSLGLTTSDTAALTQAVVQSPNTLFVFAAGNHGAQDEPFYPCAIQAPNVICVAWTDEDGTIDQHSNWGTRYVDIAAPGNNIWSTAPWGFKQLSGTSMASPLVAGVAALLFAREPWLTPAQAKAAILAGAKRTPALAGRVASGGLLNAFGALQAARDTDPPGPFAITAPGAGLSATRDVTVAWTPAVDARSGVDHYDVLLDDAQVARTGSTSDVVGGVSDGAHTVDVRAVDRDGNATVAAAVAVVVDTLPPGAPVAQSPVAGATVTTRQPTLSWTPSTDAGSGIDHYDVSVDGAAPLRVGAAQTSAAVAGELGDGRHTWTVTAVDRAGNATASAPATFTVPGALASVASVDKLRLTLRSLRVTRAGLLAHGLTTRCVPSHRATCTASIAMSRATAVRLLGRGAKAAVLGRSRSGSTGAKLKIVLARRLRSALRRAHGTIRLQLLVTARDAAGRAVTKRVALLVR